MIELQDFIKLMQEEFSHSENNNQNSARRSVIEEIIVDIDVRAEMIPGKSGAPDRTVLFVDSDSSNNKKKSIKLQIRIRMSDNYFSGPADLSGAPDLIYREEIFGSPDDLPNPSSDTNIGPHGKGGGPED